VAISEQEYMGLKKRWGSLVKRLGSVRDASDIFETVIGCYEHPGRHYHSGRHLLQVLEELDGVQDNIRNSEAVELALWLHDLVYEPGSTVNEAVSASAACAYALQIRGSSDFAAAIAALILATRHSDEPRDPDTALLLDIDLAILGHPPEAFSVYEVGIRKEFSFLPQSVYRRKRQAFLEAFLERQTIYHTACFQDRYERAARENIRNLLAGWQ